MKTLKLFAASFAVVSAVGMTAPALATTTKATPTKAGVVLNSAKASKASKQVQAKRARLPRTWTWQKKAVKLDGMFAKR